MCRILVVEDEAIIAENLKEVLQAAGHIVVNLGLVDEGQLAIDLAKTTTPDVIIMDITLRGDMDGIQTAVLIQRELAPGVISIIFTSAHEIEKYAPSVSFQDCKCIRKPYSDQQILDAIRLFCHDE